MNITRTLSACMIALGAAAAVSAQDAKTGAPAAPAVPAVTLPGSAPAAPAAPAATPAAPAPAFTDAQLAEEIGWFVAKRVGIADLQFSPAESEAMLKGFSSAVAGKESPYDLQKIGTEMDGFMQKKQTAYLEKVKVQNLAKSEAFFAKLKEDKTVQETPSGLRYQIVKQGQGAFPKANETVKVNYTGTLVDGTVFDSSSQRGEPAEFQLDQVIPGWTEGIQKISKGGKIKLYIPPSLAYGDDGQPNIPPGSTLIFDVELLDIKPPAAAATPAAAPAPAPPKG
jgi:FKBP-type peptidyl-prolyl cis-trans isomerase